MNVTGNNSATTRFLLVCSQAKLDSAAGVGHDEQVGLACLMPPIPIIFYHTLGPQQREQPWSTLF